MTECQSHTLLRRTTPKNENPRSVVFDFISPVSFNKSLDAPQDDLVAVWKATGSPVRILNEFQIILGKVNGASVSKRLHFSGGRWLIFLEQIDDRFDCGNHQQFHSTDICWFCAGLSYTPCTKMQQRGLRV